MELLKELSLLEYWNEYILLFNDQIFKIVTIFLFIIAIISISLDAINAIIKCVCSYGEIELLKIGFLKTLVIFNAVTYFIYTL